MSGNYEVSITPSQQSHQFYFAVLATSTAILSPTLTEDYTYEFFSLQFTANF
jgi:hypothetical protein